MYVDIFDSELSTMTTQISMLLVLMKLILGI